MWVLQDSSQLLFSPTPLCKYSAGTWLLSGKEERIRLNVFRKWDNHTFPFFVLFYHSTFSNFSDNLSLNSWSCLKNYSWSREFVFKRSGCWLCLTCFWVCGLGCGGGFWPGLCLPSKSQAIFMLHMVHCSNRAAFWHSSCEDRWENWLYCSFARE